MKTDAEKLRELYDRLRLRLKPDDGDEHERALEKIDHLRLIAENTPYDPYGHSRDA